MEASQTTTDQSVDMLDVLYEFAKLEQSINDLHQTVRTARNEMESR